jgi:hypothetical protein
MNERTPGFDRMWWDEADENNDSDDDEDGSYPTSLKEMIPKKPERLIHSALSFLFFISKSIEFKSKL